MNRLFDVLPVSCWRTATSAGAVLDLCERGDGLHVAFRLPPQGGYAVASLPVDLTLPGRYALHWNLREGRGLVETLEFKLAGAGAANMWWHRRRDVDLGAASAWKIDSHAVEFAWGPAGGGAPGQVAALELAFVGSREADGEVVIEDLILEDLDTPSRLRVRDALAGQEQTLPLPAVGWRMAERDGESLLDVILHPAHPVTGLVLHWLPGAEPCALEVLGSTPRDRDRIPGMQALPANGQGSGVQTECSMPLVTRRAAGAEVSCLYWLPVELGRLQLRLRVAPCRAGVGLREIEILTPENARTPVDFLCEVARRQPRGRMPPSLLREQIDWTVVGDPCCPHQALLTVDGRAEPWHAGFSVEPFLVADGRVLTWADADCEPLLQSMPTGRPEPEPTAEILPLPVATRRHSGLTLTTRAAAVRVAGVWGLLLHYTASGERSMLANTSLVVTLRPYQVSPPWQAWREVGGIFPLHRLDAGEGFVRVNGLAALLPCSAPERVLLGTWLQPDWALRLSTVGAETGTRDPVVEDADGLAEAACVWRLEPAAGGVSAHAVFVPFAGERATGDDWSAVLAALRERSAEHWLDAAADSWRALHAGLPQAIHPAPLAALMAVCRTALAHILINRKGPALQPGPRRYARSWVRDATTMAAALLRFGMTEPVAAFLRWYAPFVAGDGHVPCCVDGEGADPLVEHDSHGQWLYLLADYLRFSGDLALIRDLQPTIGRVVDHLCRLRQAPAPGGATATNAKSESGATGCGPVGGDPATNAATPGSAADPATDGLLPPSVSHEGYMAQPVHSYWDDTWALRGLRDAAWLHEHLGQPAAATRCRVEADDLLAALGRSLCQVMAAHQLETVPGCVEWADFDPTATACAAGQLGLAECFPDAALRRTFELFLQDWRRRIRCERPADRYTAYEIRNAQALAALGWREEACEMLGHAIATARPVSWHQWPEITWTTPGVPGHLGDLPHTWIGAEYVLALRSLWLAEEGDRLIFGRGVPAAWLDGEGLLLRSWPTPFGRLDRMHARREGDGTVLVVLEGDVQPPDGIVIALPLPADWRMDVVGMAQGGATQSPSPENASFAREAGTLTLSAVSPAASRDDGSRTLPRVAASPVTLRFRPAPARQPLAPQPPF